MAFKLSLIGGLLILVLAFTAISDAQQSIVDSTQTSLNKCYQAILNAFRADADTNQLIERLNQAINLTAQAQQLIGSDPQQAATLADQAQKTMENLTQQADAAAETAQNTLPIIPITVAVASVAVGVAIFLLGPKALWKVWFKLRKNFKVKLGNSTKKNESVFLTAEQLCAIVLVVTVIIAFISVSGFLIPPTQSEQFSELGILGPNMQLGDYPSKVVASETISLYGYVGNQMGEPMYYTVMVKLGNNETQVNPASLTPIQEYRQVIPSNGTWTFPVSITLTQAGDNQRIIFELWAYNQTANQNQYHERWGQIWVNVTAPVS